MLHVYNLSRNRECIFFLYFWGYDIMPKNFPHNFTLSNTEYLKDAQKECVNKVLGRPYTVQK